MICFNISRQKKSNKFPEVWTILVRTIFFDVLWFWVQNGPLWSFGELLLEVGPLFWHMDGGAHRPAQGVARAATGAASRLICFQLVRSSMLTVDPEKEVRSEPLWAYRKGGSVPPNRKNKNYNQDLISLKCHILTSSPLYSKKQHTSP